ncbi:hypothetical protein [Paenibacillus lemnae]|uniref:Uncharacterized protein n=1 Tax=Paenibacillus lemnae TaxID=1330551 RepID=A0A848M338_PAELE|nr:hypothetical protein [Paenibacillus lemnae]NMO95327.1 hypothetical protein [Paenibacillus lemnae]
MFEEADIKGSISILDDETYLVELSVTKGNSDSSINCVYPSSQELGGISFIDDKAGYFSPGSVGTSFQCEEVLKEQGYDLGSDIIGFSLPDSNGEYTMQFTLQKLEPN